MKLVNVEDLKVLVAVESKGEIRYGKLVTDLFDDIPTVKAIPISWIDSYITDSEIELNGNDPDKIRLMVEDWEKENDKDSE